MDTIPSTSSQPSADPVRCRLLGPVALVVQAIMGVIVVASLVIKRHYEKRKRPWRIWIWDVSKQLFGQAVLHGLNLLISDQIAFVADNNPCSLYFLNVLIDTTLGVIVLYIALRGFTWLFSVYLGKVGFESGEYGIPPNPYFWWKQLLPYTLAVISLKVVALLPLLLPATSTALLSFAHLALDYLPSALQVVFAMALFPIIMNVFQFCVVDQIIKSSQGSDKNDAERSNLDYSRIPLCDVETSGASTELGSTGVQRYASPIMRRNSSMIDSSPRSSGFMNLAEIEDPVMVLSKSASRRESSDTE